MQQLLRYNWSKTLFPGKVDDFFKKSKLHHKYFNEVEKSEKFFFKNNNFIEKNVKTTVIKQGDLNLLKKNDLKAALKSDLYIVFGSSYIKGWLDRIFNEKSNKHSYGIISVLQRFIM